MAEGPPFEVPSPEQPARPMGRGERIRASARRHPVRWLTGALGLAVALLVVVLLWRYMQTYEGTDDAQIDGHISNVGARVDGTVTHVYVEDNQYVQVGDLLVELDPRDYQLAVARAEADYQQARAQAQASTPGVAITTTSNRTRISTVGGEVADARAGLTAAQRNLDTAVAELREAEANAEKANLDVRRYRYLVTQNAASSQSYDDKAAAARVATATVDARRAAARAAAQTIVQQKARLAEQQSREREVKRNAPLTVAEQVASVGASEKAALASAAALEQARLNLSYTRVVAAVAGLVGRRSVEVGARIQAGQDLLAIVQVDTLWVTANFKENQLRRMRVGQSGRFKVDALDRRFDCSVESLPGATGARFSLFPPENATGNYVKVVQRLPVRLRIEPGQDDQRRLRPGMSVEPQIWVK